MIPMSTAPASTGPRLGSVSSSTPAAREARPSTVSIPSDSRCSSGEAVSPPTTEPPPRKAMITPTNEAVWCRPAVATEKPADSMKPKASSANASAMVIARSAGSRRM